MKTMLISTLFLLVSFFSISESRAQVPCGGGIVGIGPFGIGVVVDCPPPPPARVIIIRRRPVHHRYAPPQPVAPAPVNNVVVAPPAGLNDQVPVYNTRWTMGVMFDSSSYEDGGLAGGGVYARFMMTPRLAVEGAISTLTSCTSCNPENSRVDNRFTTSALWFFGGIRPEGLNVYVKGGLVFNNITFSNHSGYEQEATQTSLEFGAGLELRMGQWFSINAEGTFMGGAAGDDIGLGGIIEAQGKGIPSSSMDSGAFNFKIGIAAHF